MTAKELITKLDEWIESLGAKLITDEWLDSKAITEMIEVLQEAREWIRSEYA